MFVAVYTDKGEQVWVDLEVKYQDVALADVRVPNRRGSSFYSGLHRAMRDATILDEGGDPERPSEKPMRLARDDMPMGSIVHRQRENDE